MGTAAVKPSLAVGRLLRTKRKELQLKLREVSERLAARGERIPVSTLARIEQGKLDPGVRRLHLLLDLYELPPHLVADLVELETLAVDAPIEQDLQTLYDEGVEAWKRGDIARGLAYLFAVRQHVPSDEDSRLLRQKAALAFAVAARNLGKFRLARQIVDDLLCEPPDGTLLVGALVLASSVWRGLGSTEVALALLRHASTLLADDDDREAGWVLHQHAKLLLETGKPQEADEVLERALVHYRRQADTYGEARALTLRAGILDASGELERAVACARDVLSLSESHGHARVAIVAHLELGRLLAKSGLVQPGVEALRRALGQAVLLGDRNAEFLAHCHLWKAYETLGDERAEFEKKTALFLVEFVDDHSAEADDLRKLLKQGRRHGSR